MKTLNRSIPLTHQPCGCFPPSLPLLVLQYLPDALTPVSQPSSSVLANTIATGYMGLFAISI